MKPTTQTSSSRKSQRSRSGGSKAARPPIPRSAPQSNDQALSTVWKIVREHPLPAVGALAAGIGAYAVISRVTNGKSRRRR